MDPHLTSRILAKTSRCPGLTCLQAPLWMSHCSLLPPPMSLAVVAVPAPHSSLSPYSSQGTHSASHLFKLFCRSSWDQSKPSPGAAGVLGFSLASLWLRGGLVLGHLASLPVFLKRSERSASCPATIRMASARCPLPAHPPVPPATLMCRPPGVPGGPVTRSPRCQLSHSPSAVQQPRPEGCGAGCGCRCAHRAACLGLSGGGTAPGRAC